MKKQLLFFFLLIASIGNAQIIDIPDTQFKDKLLQASISNVIAKDENGNSIVIDTNDDDEIQIAEALAVYELRFSDTSIESLEGIQFFTNLTRLECDNGNISILPVENLINLEYLDFRHNNVNSFDFSMLDNLKYLNASHNLISNADITGMESIEMFACAGYNSLENVIVAGSQSLQDLIVRDSNLTSLDLTNCINLKNITADENYLTEINLTGCVSVENINVADNSLTSINLSESTGVKTLKVTSNNIETLDCTGLAAMEWVNARDNNNLSSLVLEGCISLEEIWLANNSIEELDLGELPLLYNFNYPGYNISYLDASGCPTLENLNINTSYAGQKVINIKTGVTNMIEVNYDNSAPNLYLCVEEYMLAIYQYDTQWFNDVHVGTYCTVEPGGDYNTITGSVTTNFNGTDCENIGMLPYLTITMDDGGEGGSAVTGIDSNYNFFTKAGTFTLTPNVENSDWFTISPSVIEVSFEDDNYNVATHDFCLTAVGEHSDVEVVIVPTTTAQPGFDASYKITYRNKGNQILSGNISLTYDDTVLDYVSSTSGVVNSGNTLTWSYSDLQPFDTRNINLTLNVNSPMEDPAVNIDEILSFTATVTPIAGDETPSDNIFTLDQTVVGSFDPNDIACLDGEAVHTSKIGEYLHYNINFENTGTAPATFVVVKDVINEEQFDISTLQLMDASHDVQTKITGNEVEFYFDNINLAANGGKGNVLFKIKTLDTLEENDMVTQQAEIFFDYNWPIVTNEANTVFGTLINSNVVDNYTSVKIYPNPTVDNVTIIAKDIVESVQLYDLQGRLLQANTINDTQTTINLSAQPSGLYFVKIITEEGSVVEKLVKQ